MIFSTSRTGTDLHHNDFIFIKGVMAASEELNKARKLHFRRAWDKYSVKLGLKMKDMAEKKKVALPTISGVLNVNNLRQPVNLDYALFFADVLGCSIEETWLGDIPVQPLVPYIDKHRDQSNLEQSAVSYPIYKLSDAPFDPNNKGFSVFQDTYRFLKSQGHGFLLAVETDENSPAIGAGDLCWVERTSIATPGKWHILKIVERDFVLIAKLNNVLTGLTLSIANPSVEDIPITMEQIEVYGQLKLALPRMLG